MTSGPSFPKSLQFPFNYTTLNVTAPLFSIFLFENMNIRDILTVDRPSGQKPAVFRRNIMAAPRRTFLVFLIVLTAFNLRASLAIVGPLLSFIETDLSLSAAAAGLLTTLPLLIFALFSPFVSKAGIKFGGAATIFSGLAVMTAGILLRVTGSIPALFTGTALIGYGIIVGNVLIPGVIKHHFPEKIGIMTGLFTTTMCLSSAIASAICVPIAEKSPLGWRGSFLTFAFPAAVALCFWFPLLRRKSGDSTPSGTSGFQELLHSGIAWQVSAFMGLQSFLFYCLLSWLPQIIASHGISAASSGYSFSLFQIIAIPASFLAPIIAERAENQIRIATVSSLIYTCGALVLLTARNVPLLVLSIVLMGIASGSSFSLCFAFFSIRAGNKEQATKLSGMAQCVGYLVASVGPVLFGALNDRFHSWTIPLLIFIGMTILLMFTGRLAGRNVKI